MLPFDIYIRFLTFLISALPEIVKQNLRFFVPFPFCLLVEFDEDNRAPVLFGIVPEGVGSAIIIEASKDEFISWATVSIYFSSQ